METEQKNKGRILKGVVVSDKMTKTVVVAVTRLKMHPKYKKQYKVTTKFKAHDETGVYHTGDRVLMQETRRLSKDKRWIVLSKVK
ncbi:MAG: 30S ribosomal protein S17 [Candidatus Yanofskybacteria bacterium RIFCSPLOWO2_01_FULL_49_25]|uniref:Small ribosomal subunit protein uS17 n=1 Tax=Candidatus Yanofskybacteria bacterium RIFCSPLOWO2_01_FULL_49_25 TaxID=1802701 RepID=A0A1F8GWX2_9BACT|nr:MAG: 30S ribosomal protein S17 [Candidatus Yanofskybacteria bacterium RIFCSPLOWO2_01_FULL_49_25]